MWDGPNKLWITNAQLREAGITIDEFKTAWNEQRRRSLNTDEDRRKHLQLIDQGGFGHYHDKIVDRDTMRQKVWFIKRIVGRDTSESAPATTSVRETTQVCNYTCILRLLTSCRSLT